MASLSAFFSKSKYIFTLLASAVMLLSIISATALSNEYPISLNDSMRDVALGSNCIDLIIYSLDKIHYNSTIIKSPNFITQTF